MTTYTKKPRLVRVNNYYSAVAPRCPICKRTDKIAAVDVGQSWHFVCDRCKHALTYEEAEKGQKEVEQ